MIGKDLKDIMENVLIDSEIELWCSELEIIQRERKLDIKALIRSMILTSTSPAGAFQADVLRTYLMNEVKPVSRTAFYNWFDEKLEVLMEKLSNHAIEFAKKETVDLPGILSNVNDWIIVDSTTCKIPDCFKDEYKGTGDYAALKVHKYLSVGYGIPIHYHFSKAREHDSKHLEINEEWNGLGLLADLAYASHARLRDCIEYNVKFVVRLKENWKAHILEIKRGEVKRNLFRSADFDVLLEEEIIILDGKAVDAIVVLGQGNASFKLRLVGVPTPKGYCWYLTNIERKIGPLQIGLIYRIRWEVELSMKLDKSDFRMNESSSQNTQNIHAVRSLIHASLIGSIIIGLLVHRHNMAIAKRCNGGARNEPPIHARRLAMLMVAISDRISRVFEMNDEEAALEWDKLAKKMTFNGVDPNWRNKPSPLDQIKGWKKHSTRRRKQLKNNRKTD